MDLRQGPWWTKSTLPPTGLAYVHRVHACVVGGGIFPLLPCRRVPTGDVLTGVLPQQR